MTDDKVQFLKSLSTFGDPTKYDAMQSVKACFDWGSSGPYDKNDYTKKKAELGNKIRKMHRGFISESRDNYRDPKNLRSGKEDDIACTVGVCTRCKQPGHVLKFLMGEIDETVKIDFGTKNVKKYKLPGREHGEE
jgi:hypothetical protein